MSNVTHKYISWWYALARRNSYCEQIIHFWRGQITAINYTDPRQLYPETNASMQLVTQSILAPKTTVATLPRNKCDHAARNSIDLCAEDVYVVGLLAWDHGYKLYRSVATLPETNATMQPIRGNSTLKQMRPCSPSVATLP
ncbi:hypothetical protein RclHR1_00940005 [Rhizophagus clarus]|uniref:Uncharacterized protein n=1 Tax=Rhizophagus clarus TaxID=94130 RepID=A0A2Z6S4B1_9GLOM|nr:hypothetical protein RclHR1_00940005 [Rhizophagus clarus]